MMLQSATLSLFCLLLPLATANGDDCTGDPGYGLTATPEVARLGDPVDLCVSAPAGDFVLLLVSASPGPIDSGMGMLCLGLPLAYSIPLTVPVSGQLCLPTYVHCDQAMYGSSFYAQFVSFATDGSESSGRSNQVAVSVVDDGTGCNFCTGNTKSRLLRMKYTGKDCSATKHSQRRGTVRCSGDPAFEPKVRIVVKGRSKHHPGPAKLYFDGEVTLNGVFDIDSYAVGKKRLKGNVTIRIFDLEGQLLQKVRFHVSCCQPLHGYDEFGSLQLLGFIARGQ